MRFSEAFRESLELAGILVRQNFAAVLQRVIRVDSQKVVPGRARLVWTVEMAVARCQQHARNIGLWVAGEPSLQVTDRWLVFGELESRLRVEMQQNVLGVRVQCAAAVETLDGLSRPAGIE